MSYLNYSPDAVFLCYLLIFENQQWDIPNINYGNFYQVSIIQSEDIRILEGPLCFETVGTSLYAETPHFRYIAIFRYRREVTSETSAFICQAGIFRFLLDIKVSFRPRFQLSTGRDFRLFAILL